MYSNKLIDGLDTKLRKINCQTIGLILRTVDQCSKHHYFLRRHIEKTTDFSFLPTLQKVFTMSPTVFLNSHTSSVKTSESCKDIRDPHFKKIRETAEASMTGSSTSTLLTTHPSFELTAATALKKATPTMNRSSAVQHFAILMPLPKWIL